MHHAPACPCCACRGSRDAVVAEVAVPAPCIPAAAVLLGHSGQQSSCLAAPNGSSSCLPPATRTRPPLCMASARTFARLDAFARGAIWGMHCAGSARDEIVDTVTKKDGSAPSLKAVDETIAHKTEDPEWRGEDSAAGGRPQELSAGDKKDLVRLVFRERAKAVVTIKYCQKRLPRLRGVSRCTILRALHNAGMKWLRRRVKQVVTKKHKQPRIDYCDWILSCSNRTLARFAYTDGTTFYLARDDEEQALKGRAALGKFVWRMPNGKDGLHSDNVGPSMYGKAQGKPVKIWGLFAHGRLEYYVLPKDKAKSRLRKREVTVNMTAARYEALVAKDFAAWRRNCFGDDRRAFLVQDHEKCLWKPKCLAALRAAGFDILENFPKSSPDLNAIEAWWHRLRQRLEATAPMEIESRPAFLLRLRRTVHWMNEHWHDDALALATNQQERATAVKKLKGARCQW